MFGCVCVASAALSYLVNCTQACVICVVVDMRWQYFRITLLGGSSCHTHAVTQKALLLHSSHKFGMSTLQRIFASFGLALLFSLFDVCRSVCLCDIKAYLLTTCCCGSSGTFFRAKLIELFLFRFFSCYFLAVDFIVIYFIVSFSFYFPPFY